MKIFVTVGTTEFDSLILSVDSHCSCSHDYSVIYQTCHNIPGLNAESFTFTKDVQSYYMDSDLIITHGGAGSIYKLLELNKKIIVCPNFERVDHHQDEICRYIEKNNYALISWNVDSIGKAIDKAKTFIPNKYIKTDFFKFKEISNIIC